MAAIFTCSVDDGHPSDMRVAELLDRYGLQATFYVPITNQEGRPVLAAADLRALAGRFEVGSHTYSHQFLTRVDSRTAAREIFTGKEALQGLLGRQVDGFCYPGGRYRAEHRRMVRAAGFTYARTTLNLCRDPGAGRFDMATSCQFYPHGRGVYSRNFLRGGSWFARYIPLLIMLREGDWQARLYKYLEVANTQGWVFHLWLHASDVDELDAWRELEILFSAIDQSVYKTSRLNNKTLSDLQFGKI